MEPAVHRREHTIGGAYDAWLGGWPQWSPPVTGGSTSAVPVVSAPVVTSPQWSPPWNNGRVAIGHAPYAGYPLPQWSPLVNSRKPGYTKS